MRKKTKDKKEEIAAIAEVFGRTSKAKATKKKKKTTKKKDREIIQLPKPFDLLVAGQIVANALKKLKAKKKYANLKAQIFDYYFTKFTKNGKIAPSCVGECGEATALFTLRQMASISEDTAELLKKHQIPYAEDEIVLEGLMLNPEVMFDQDLLAKLAMAVKKLKEFKDVKLFLDQEAVCQYTATEETYKKVAKIKDVKVREKLLKQLTNLAMSQSKLDDSSEAAQIKALKLLSKKGVFDIQDDEDDDFL
jgi:hypothetical protein